MNGVMSWLRTTIYIWWLTTVQRYMLQEVKALVLEDQSSPHSYFILTRVSSVIHSSGSLEILACLMSLTLFFYHCLSLCVYVCGGMGGWGVHTRTHVNVRGQLCGVRSLSLPLCTDWGLNSSHLLGLHSKHFYPPPSYLTDPWVIALKGWLLALHP